MQYAWIHVYVCLVFQHLCVLVHCVWMEKGRQRFSPLRKQPLAFFSAILWSLSSNWVKAHVKDSVLFF